MSTEVPLTYMDAAMIDAVNGGGPFRRPITLFELLDRIDFENRTTPTFDQVNYGLARLLSRGFMKASHSPKRGLRLASTDEGRNLRREAGQLRRKHSPHRWPRIGEYTAAIAELVGAPTPSDYGDVGNHSIGRLPKLTQAEWESVMREYRADGQKWAKRAARLSRWLSR